MNYPMSKEQDRIEREQAAERLRQARERKGFKKATTAANNFGWPVETYKAHDSGRNGFSTADARKYARAYACNLEWLVLGTGDPFDVRQLAIQKFEDEAEEELVGEKIDYLNDRIKQVPVNSLPEALDAFGNYLDVQFPIVTNGNKKP